MPLNLVLSTSKITDFETCPLLYYYRNELEILPLKKASYFEEGELLHEMLRLFYLIKMNDELSKISRVDIYDHGRNWAAKNVQLTAEQVEKVIFDINFYFNSYWNSDSWEILGVEEPFARVIHESEDLRIVINGKNDLRIRTLNGKGPVTIVDHKYESRFEQKPERDNQPLCYTWAYEVKDFIYNRVGKHKSTKPEDKLQRPSFCFLQYQIDDWVKSIVDCGYEIVKAIQNDYFPMRYTGCSFHGNKCTYYEICNTSPDNRQYKITSMFKKNDKTNVMGDKQ